VKRLKSLKGQRTPYGDTAMDRKKKEKGDFRPCMRRDPRTGRKHTKSHNNEEKRERAIRTVLGVAIVTAQCGGGGKDRIEPGKLTFIERRNLS